MKKILSFLIFTLFFLLISSKSNSVEVRDCFERLNRATFAFNQSIDKVLFKPLAKGYRKLPVPIRTGTNNVVSNLSNLITIPNNVLQGDLKAAGLNTARLTVNTTIGIFGIFDVAQQIGLVKNYEKEDYGQTLGKDLKNLDKKLQLTLDTNIQYLIRNELIKFKNIFRSQGSAALLMNINNGDILSLVSLPDFNINQRNDITDLKYINRITKGVYELGSIFKTFTLAGAINEKIVDKNTNFKNLPKSIYCADRKISEYDMDIPTDLTAEQILIRSGNIGSVRIAQRMGIEKTKKFLNSLNLLDTIEFDLEEIGKPLPVKWGKCKLATVSFGHGISTTPLQIATAYAIISNGGYLINPTLIKQKKKNVKTQVLNKDVSNEINSILRKIVSTKEGTANLANIDGYDVGGKTGTAQKIENGVYTKKKINTFVSIFPINKPKYVLLVLLDEPKTNSEYIYNYRDGSGIKYKGTPYNTAGWTSVEVAGKIIEKIGPILATKYNELY